MWELQGVGFGGASLRITSFFRVRLQGASFKEALKYAERVLVFGAGASCGLSPRNARPFLGKIPACD